MSRQALRELRDGVRANPDAAEFLLMVLSTAPEVVVRKQLGEMLRLGSFTAPHFDGGWMTGGISKKEVATALALLLNRPVSLSRNGWATVAGSGQGEPPAELLPRTHR